MKKAIIIMLLSLLSALSMPNHIYVKPLVYSETDTKNKVTYYKDFDGKEYKIDKLKSSNNEGCVAIYFDGFTETSDDDKLITVAEYMYYTHNDGTLSPNYYGKE